MLQDAASYKATQETRALLEILTLGTRDIEAGRVRPIAEVVQQLRMKKADTF